MPAGVTAAQDTTLALDILQQGDASAMEGHFRDNAENLKHKFHNMTEAGANIIVKFLNALECAPLCIKEHSSAADKAKARQHFISNILTSLSTHHLQWIGWPMPLFCKLLAAPDVVISLFPCSHADAPHLALGVLSALDKSQHGPAILSALVMFFRRCICIDEADFMKECLLMIGDMSKCSPVAEIYAHFQIAWHAYVEKLHAHVLHLKAQVNHQLDLAHNAVMSPGRISLWLANIDKHHLMLLTYCLGQPLGLESDIQHAIISAFHNSGHATLHSAATTLLSMGFADSVKMASEIL